MEVEGKTVIVTGAGRGIGRATSILFAKKGANVVLASRTVSEINKVSEEIHAFGKVAFPVKTDVRDSNSVKNLIQKTVERFNTIDILINNAGIAIRKYFIDTEESEFDDVMATNVKGVFLCCKEAIPHMMRQKDGIIVNVSSGTGKSGFPELSAYCASKFAVIGLTESLAIELIEYGIRVYAVCPGSTDTKMFRSLYPERSANLKKPEYVAESILRICEKENIAPGSCVDVY